MPITVLVVDDSALMRRTIRQAFEAAGDFVVHQARDGRDALAQIAAVNPDVVTLDINMPVMDGLTCLSHIMTDHPRPVVMVSSLTEAGALATFEALEMGAIDYMPKPDGTISLRLAEVVPQLIGKVRAAVGSRAAPAPAAPRRASRAPCKGRPRQVKPFSVPSLPGAVLVGVSTGGPRTLDAIIPELPANFPLPVVIAQHMPERFTKVFAERLDGASALEVMEVARPEPLRPGVVYIGRGGCDVVLERRLGRIVAVPVAEDASPWHPSVDRLVRSAMQVLPPESLIAVELTGMGNDGAAEMTELRRRGGHTIAESEDSCIVFGMPCQLIALGGASEVLAAGDIAGRLADLGHAIAARAAATAE